VKILIVPDSFKGSATNVQVARQIEAGVLTVMPGAECMVMPLADGGEGSLNAIELALGGERKVVSTVDPLQRSVQSNFLHRQGLSFIELAQESGLQLLNSSECKAGLTSTYGTGLVLGKAIKQSAEIILCIGGSATNDAACGIAQALGYQFLDKQGQAFLPVGSTLINIDQILSPVFLPDVKIRVLCDVKNPLTGPMGATNVYGPQKGGTEDELIQMEKGMEHLREKIIQWKSIDLNTIAGAGAAGGVGGGMVAFFNASLESGIEYFMDQLGIERQIEDCDLIFTGEGSIDQQTKQGKLISGVTGLAEKYQKPVIAICGALNIDIEETSEIGLTAAFSILSNLGNKQDVFASAPALIKQTTAQIMSVIKNIAWIQK